MNVFISYRREDTAFVSGLIHERLAARFGADAIFTDVDSIPLGVNFKKYIDEQVGKSDIFLVVIGEKWLGAVDDDGRARLEKPEDFVRIEIESALKREIPVIPLLVGDIQMPSTDELPESLIELAVRNGTQIRPKPSFDADVDRLIKGIERHLATAEKPEEQGQATEEDADQALEEKRPREAQELAEPERQAQRVPKAPIETATLSPEVEDSARQPEKRARVPRFLVLGMVILAVSVIIVGGWWSTTRNTPVVTIAGEIGALAGMPFSVMIDATKFSSGKVEGEFRYLRDAIKFGGDVECLEAFEKKKVVAIAGPVQYAEPTATSGDWAVIEILKGKGSNNKRIRVRTMDKSAALAGCKKPSNSYPGEIKEDKLILRFF